MKTRFQNSTGTCLYNNLTTSMGSAGAKKYQYNGKLERSGNPALAGELQEDFGLDWYDYGARFYDAAIARWTTADPLAEKAYNWTPYRYAFDNPVNITDPNGMFESTHTDKDGNVVAVYDDGDLGVYKHKGNEKQALAEVEKNHSENNTSAGGEKMGETIQIYSFADFGKVEKGTKGNIVAAGARIDFNSTWSGDKIESSLSEISSFSDYARNALGKYNIKFAKDNPGNEYFGSRLADGTIVSARDAGNMLAGIVSAKYGLPKNFAYNGFGALNIAHNNLWLGALVLYSNYFITISSFGIIKPQKLIFGETRGEDRGSFNAIKYGRENYKNF
jgi:RHS repeat-associated protein